MTLNLNTPTLVAIIAATAIGSFQIGNSQQDEEVCQIEHAPYQVNDLLFYSNPTDIRTNFRNEFGTYLLGWAFDVEQDPLAISGIIEAFNYERLVSDFDLGAIRIEPDQEMLQSLTWKDHRSRAPKLVGAYNHDMVYILNGQGEGTIHHEIIHGKLESLLESDSDLFEEWNQFSVDSDGNTLYDSVIGEDSKKSDTPKCETDSDCVALGFVNKNSRRNIEEDIAYLVEESRINPESFVDWLYDNLNSRIEGKVKVAQKYNLIPEDFIGYVSIKKILEEINEDNSSILDMDKVKDFFIQSEIFLNENPSTLYGSEIHYERSIFLKTTYPSFAEKGHEDELDAVINELMAVVYAPFSDGMDYLATLSDLSNIHRVTGDDHLADIYSRAKVLYLDRFNAADPKFATKGAFDFLEENGAL